MRLLVLLLAGSTWRAAAQPVERAPDRPARYKQAADELAALHHYASDPEDAPTLVKNPAPDYPESARRKCVEGVVVLLAAVDPQGRVVDVKVAKSIPELDEAATKCVRSWRFKPARTADVAVGTVVELSLNFVNHTKTPETCGQGRGQR